MMSVFVFYLNRVIPKRWSCSFSLKIDDVLLFLKWKHKEAEKLATNSRPDLRPRADLHHFSLAE